LISLASVGVVAPLVIHDADNVGTWQLFFSPQNPKPEFLDCSSQSLLSTGQNEGIVQLLLEFPHQ